jgi:hypothetical protein
MNNLFDEPVPRRGGMSSHQSASSESEVWLTPPDILAGLGQFDLDPCAAPEPRPWPTAKEHFTRADDGFNRPWKGRVFLNPPYGNAASNARWLERLADHNHGTALIFARTETEAFHEQVWPKAAAILFFKGRLHFHHPDGRRAKDNGGAPSCLIAYGPVDAVKLEHAHRRGGAFQGAFLDLRMMRA